MSLIKRIDELSSKRNFKRGWFGLVCAVFVFLIIIPAIYVLFEAVAEWDAVSDVLNDASAMSTIWTAVYNSFSIAFIVTIIDIIVGLPMAWIMVRKQFAGKKYIDTLIDMPLAVPTAVLGISVVMFWGAPSGVTIPGLGWVLTPYLMMVLLHIIFTYPYMVRSLSAILEQIDPNYETAGMTLGASRFTAARTITLPLFRAGLTTGFILCFARSLSETGGTFIALEMMGMSNVFFTGPTYIQVYKATSMGPVILISVIMIILAILLLFVAKYIMNKVRIPWSRVWPKWERKISRGLAVRSRDVITMGVLLFIVLIPAFYIFTYMTASGAPVNYGDLTLAIATSFLIAGIAVVFDVVFGIPMAMYIARHGDTRLGRALDNLVNVPLIIPTTALGVSLSLFWGHFDLSSFTLLLVVLGHISFTYPLMVRNIIGAMEEVDVSYEEVALTLGAKPFQAFRKVLLPIIKSSVIAGGILAFTRSLGETGATVAISSTVMTAPIYIMNLVKAGSITGDYYAAAISSIILIVICFILMFMVRRVTRDKEGNE
ncbi:MAG: iron ABC transporter permease [Candidatus Methanomethylophilaceae archaeon]